MPVRERVSILRMSPHWLVCRSVVNKAGRNHVCLLCQYTSPGKYAVLGAQ